MTNLNEKKCIPCEGGIAPLTHDEALQLLNEITDWQMDAEATLIHKALTFKNFYQTMGFVNAIAWIANRQNHHPDLKIGYNYCHITLTTHAIKALSNNDFIIAAQIDQLLK